MIVEPFGGPGGWSEGLRLATGRRALGIETDVDACATRRAAGHMALRRDVSTMDPARFAAVEGVIASPPCTAFSNAGKRKGRKWLPVLVSAIRRRQWDHRALRLQDPTIWLPLEVGRWVEATEPEWVALEQVPPALALWEAYAEVLEEWGYSVWYGVLDAANFGVPQTRRRAFLIASCIGEGVVAPPVPTHDKRGHEAGLRPWVSMARALPELADQLVGPWWKDRPATTIAGDPRVFPPGGHIAHDGRDNSKMVGRSATKIRLTIDQALVLQSFPPDYPVQGNKTSQFRQVGNAVPPLLAAAVLGQVVSRSGHGEAVA